MYGFITWEFFSATASWTALYIASKINNKYTKALEYENFPNKNFKNLANCQCKQNSEPRRIPSLIEF